MKNTFFFLRIGIATIILTFPFTLIAQETLVNQLWETQLNYPDTITWSNSYLDNNGNLFTTGNTWHNSTQKVNIVTTKINSSGTTVWSTQYNGTASGYDYGVAITVDGSGNVFVAGATHNTSSYTFDVVVIKYNSSGTQQWASLYNGTGSGMDIPSDILLDGSGNIYVDAASVGTSTSYDYALLKLNSSGSISWTSRYDYTSLNDVPGYIKMQSTNVVVAGASQSSSTNWDYTMVKYNSSGILVNSTRTSTTGYGFDRPTGIVVDNASNLYITGYAFNGTDYDLRTIKLDEDITPIWTVTIDHGDEDGSNAIATDTSGKYYIAGFRTNSEGSKEMDIVKYNSSGVQQWEKIIPNLNNTINAEATSITYNAASDKILVTGFYEYATSKKVIIIFALSRSNGAVSWSKSYPNLENSIDVPTSIKTTNNHIWVAGRRTVVDTSRYLTVKYELYDHSTENILDGSDNPICRDNELIVRFNPSLLDPDFINDKQQVYASLNTALVDSTYEKILPLLKGSNSQFAPKCIKIYKDFTSLDTLSISRNGNKFKIPPFWAAFEVTCDISVDEFELADTLGKFLNEILWAEPNWIGELADEPNDEDYLSQYSFYNSTDYTDIANIHIEGAWDFETGNENLKVGILDSPLDWQHEDFGDGTVAGSKIKGGYDFQNSVAFPYMDLTAEDQDHGTACAGIIGALRNNDIGIAGIAGGDRSASPENAGVSLYSMAICPLDDPGHCHWTYAHLSEAIVTGAYSGPEPYSGLNIMNCSNSGTSDAESQKELKLAVDFAYKNEVVFVASRGNGSTSSSAEQDPAGFRIGPDNWRVLCVGAAGIDGERKTPDNSGLGGSTYYSLLDGGIDLIAPGAYDMIWTTAVGNEYMHFDNTSAAAPHVTGVAGLMLSYYNNNPGAPNQLAPEDVEWIFQESADNTPDHPEEWDIYTGHGMLNGETSLTSIELPYNQLKHFPSGDPPLPSYYHATSTDVWIHIPFGTPGLPFGGVFLAEPWNVEFEFHHFLPESAEFIAGWNRNATATGCPDIGLGEIDDLETYYRGSELMEPITASIAKIRTRVYKIIADQYNDPLDTPVWYPQHPNDTYTST